MKWLVMCMVATAGFVATGCDVIEQEVDYILTCDEVMCPDANETTEYTTNGATGFACAWSCGDYEGAVGVSVNLTFAVGDDGCLELASQEIATGFCE